MYCTEPGIIISREKCLDLWISLQDVNPDHDSSSFVMCMKN